MSGSSKKVVGVLVVLAVICAGAYFFVVPRLEAQQGEKVAEFIAKLPGKFTAGEVTVGFFDKKVTIKDLKGKPDPGAGTVYDIHVDLVELEGVNLDAGVKPGAVRLADSIVIQGFKETMAVQMPELGQPIIVNLSCQEMVFKGVSGDLAQLLALNKLPSLPQQPTEEELQNHLNIFNVMMSALGTIHIDRFEAKKYAFDMPTPLAISGTINALSYSDASITKIGSMLLDDLKVSALNNEILSIAKMSCQGMIIPDMFSLKIDPKNPEQYGKEVLAAFAKTPMVLKDFALEKVSVKPMTPEAVTLDRVEYDLEIGPEKILFNKDVKNLVIPVSVYSQLGGEAAMFGAVHKKPLEFDGTVDLQVNQKDGNGDALLKNLQVVESNLGNVLVSGEIPFVGRGEGFEGLLKNGAAFLVKSATMTIEDKSGLETLLAAQVQQMGGLIDEDKSDLDALLDEQEQQLPFSVATLRSGIVDALRAEAAQAATDRKKIIEGFAQLVGAPGKLTISVAPEQPVPVDDIYAEGVALNAKVEYIPAK